MVVVMKRMVNICIVVAVAGLGLALSGLGQGTP